MDLTTILAAAIAGSSGVAAGYLGMRQQTQMTREQLDRQAAHEHETRRDTLLDTRKETYRRLLDVERGLRRLVASGRASSKTDYTTWWADYQQAHNLTVLTGMGPVRDHAERLARLYGAVDRDRLESRKRSASEALTHAFRRHGPEIEQTRAALVDAMRGDVAPQEYQHLSQPGAHAPRPTQAARRQPRVEHRTIAVSCASDAVSRAEVEEVVAAVQKQIHRDAGPIWNVSATLTLVDRIEDIPAGTWPVAVVDDPDVVSYHSNLADWTPYVMVSAQPGWQLRFSHEILEVLVSPESKRVVEAPSPDPRQGRVWMLVQICDACEAPDYAYEIDGVTVSDFCTPAYYEPRYQAGERYSHMGDVMQPLDVLPGGHQVWYDPVERELWQRQSGGPSQLIGGYAGLEEAIQAHQPAEPVGFSGG